MKKMNLWSVLHYSEATQSAEAIAFFFKISPGTVCGWIQRKQNDENMFQEIMKE